jgi:hypothetical protein
VQAADEEPSLLLHELPGNCSRVLGGFKCSRQSHMISSRQLEIWKLQAATRSDGTSVLLKRCMRCSSTAAAFSCCNQP